jgi:hypothetical protein
LSLSAPFPSFAMCYHNVDRASKVSSSGTATAGFVCVSRFYQSLV